MLQKQLEQHSTEVHNSRRPLDRLTLTLTLTFDLIFIGGRVISVPSLAVLVSVVMVARSSDSKSELPL